LGVDAKKAWKDSFFYEIVIRIAVSFAEVILALIAFVAAIVIGGLVAVANILSKPFIFLGKKIFNAQGNSFGKENTDSSEQDQPTQGALNPFDSLMSRASSLAVYTQVKQHDDGRHSETYKKNSAKALFDSLCVFVVGAVMVATLEKMQSTLTPFVMPLMLTGWVWKTLQKANIFPMKGSPTTNIPPSIAHNPQRTREVAPPTILEQSNSMKKSDRVDEVVPFDPIQACLVGEKKGFFGRRPPITGNKKPTETSFPTSTKCGALRQ
jgi:hypothetical protein